MDTCITNTKKEELNTMVQETNKMHLNNIKVYKLKRNNKRNVSSIFNFVLLMRQYLTLIIQLIKIQVTSSLLWKLKFLEI